jgi:hypothetical protein
MPDMITALLPWIQVVGPLLVIGIIILTSVVNQKTYKSVREELSLAEKQIRELHARTADLASLKYRMDVFEGKHLRARNLGMGLPQPRNREEGKSGD